MRKLNERDETTLHITFVTNICPKSTGGSKDTIIRLVTLSADIARLDCMINYLYMYIYMHTNICPKYPYQI